MGLNWEVVEPKTKGERKKRPTVYREQKIAAHTTVGGKGKIARLRQRGRP